MTIHPPIRNGHMPQFDFDTLMRPPSSDTGHRFGNWLQTYRGGKFWPMDPRAAELDIQDIAHALSMLCRYAGHCVRFYSVAEHSVLVARWLRDVYGADQRTVLCGLLHDATEAYLADVPRPVKPFLPGYKDAEDRLWHEIARWSGLPAEMPAAVHEADNRILNDEHAQNMTTCVDAWGYSGEPLGITLQFWSPAEAEAAFLDMFVDVAGAK